VASITNPNAAQRLEMLRGLRMRGQAPAGTVMVTTQRGCTETFEQMRLATIEVWPGILHRLDWSGVAGLYVAAVVHWRSQDERMQLFEAIRAAQPRELLWVATTPGNSVVMIEGEVRIPLYPELWGDGYGRV
jgi:hypothetical protein